MYRRHTRARPNEVRPVDEGASSPPSTLRPINEPGTSGARSSRSHTRLRQGVRHHRLRHRSHPPHRQRPPSYENCGEARAAGAAPIYEGEPGSKRRMG
ncbi:excalibur calcium-binding domain-containing protein [Streptomyces sp. NPDC054837]